MKKIMFSGARPTGLLHLGHYFGALKEYLKYQDEYEMYFIISDFNMMTTKITKTELQKVKNNIINMVIDLIGLGFDPQKTTFFIQSNIPEIASIYLLIQNLVSTERLKIIPCTAQMSQNSTEDSTSLGLFGFSVLVTANVLGAQADFVPLGKDAVDHLILSQEIIKKINSSYDADFKVPAYKAGTEKEIIGTDGDKKMSKSLNNTIFIRDTEAEVNKKIDMINWINTSGEENIVLSYIKLFENNDKFISELSARIDSGEYIETYAKNYLKEKINKFLAPIQININHYLENKEMIEEILKEGNKKARATYSETLNKLKKSMDLYEL